MRDYIVTHASTGTAYFKPRVVRAYNATEALRATIKDLQWADRKIVRSQAKASMFDVEHFGRWHCDRWDGTWGERDSLDVQPYVASEWTFTELVRLNRYGHYVDRINE